MVESPEEAFRRDYRGEIRVGDLAGGMDSGVGSAGGDRGNRRSTGELLQRRLELALNRALLQLPLPAVKAGSKV
jgi:hypothetical protein